MPIPGTLSPVGEPQITFVPLPEPMPLLLGWPDAAGENITDKVKLVLLGDVELLFAARTPARYKLEFTQHDANAYVIFNGIDE